MCVNPLKNPLSGIGMAKAATKVAPPTSLIGMAKAIGQKMQKKKSAPAPDTRISG